MCPDGIDVRIFEGLQRTEIDHGRRDVHSSAGLAGNRMMAAMAAGASAPGEATWVPIGQAADWLYPRPVTPVEPSAQLGAGLTLGRDCLDPARQHRAVLGLADRIGQRLRAERQIAGRLTLTVRYADSAYRQLSMDPGDDRARAAEAAADRARRRFGPRAVRAAALAEVTGKFY